MDLKRGEMIPFLEPGCGRATPARSPTRWSILFADATAVGGEAFEYTRHRFSPPFLRVCCVRGRIYFFVCTGTTLFLR